MVREASIRRAHARRHMEEAKGLLTDAGALPAATYLEYAIACVDLAGDGGGEIDDGEPFMVGPRDPVLVRAIGGAFAIVGTILARSDVVPLDELARLFGIFATVSADEDPGAGTIIAAWGGMMLDAARE